MKAALINASPKRRGSASAILLEALADCLPADTQLVSCPLHTGVPEDGTARQLADCDALVFACPLYVDALPAHMLAALAVLEGSLRQSGSGARVYAVINCGFYEGWQTENALHMLRCWSKRAGLGWGRGVGVGAGGMLHALKSVPMGEGAKAGIEAALKELAGDLVSGRGGEDLFTGVTEMTLKEQQASVEGLWRRLAEKNGLTEESLNRTEFT